MTIVAIFDTNAGFLQWIGEAASHEAAIKALEKEVGLYETSADRDDVLDSADDPSLIVYDLNADQAAAVQAWADEGNAAGDWPLDEPGSRYTKGEILEIAES